MAYIVVRKTEVGLEPASRAFAKRSAAESRRHALALRHPDWELAVAVEARAAAIERAEK